MRLSGPFGQPFYVGGVAGVTQAGTTPFDVVLNGVGFMVDFQSANDTTYSFDSIPMLQAMFLEDRGTLPIGEHSLTPHDYWRRSVDDWSNGSGQLNLDHADSANNRYRLSKGCDPWTAGQISLLHDVTRISGAEMTFSKVVVAGEFLYWLSVSTVGPITTFERSTDLVTFTDVTASTDDPLSGVTDITTDGYTVWVADSARLHYTTRDVATFTKWHTSDETGIYLVRAVKGRLFTAAENTIFKNTMTAGSSVMSSYFEPANSDWVWTDIEGGPNAVYFSGYSGSESAIYMATIKTDGTDLDAPFIVATMPSGEIVRSMKTYLSVMVIGTDKGWRIAEMDASGGLTLGALVTMDNPPLCFEAQDRFVWYGWTNYDGESTGLGRIDLSAFNDTTPAYASDLMADGQGTVTSVVTFGDKRVFTTLGPGLFAEADTYVPRGTVTTGGLNYALADPKVAVKLNVQYRKGEGTIAAQLATDDDVPRPIGQVIETSAVAGNSSTLTTSQTVGRVYELVFTITSNSDQTDAPAIDRFTFMVEPQPERRSMWTVPLMLATVVTNRLGQNQRYDPDRERQRIYNLMQSRQIVPFQDYNVSYNVIVDDFHWVPYEHLIPDHDWPGTIVVKLKVIS